MIQLWDSCNCQGQRKFVVLHLRFDKVLKFNLTESRLLCVLPWLTMAVFANIGGWIADTLVSKGLSVTTVHKIMQSIGFLGPAFFLTHLSHVKTPALAIYAWHDRGLDAFSVWPLLQSPRHWAPICLLCSNNLCKVVAIGECGLDYDRLHFCPPDVQKKYFEKQFELAYLMKSPMFRTHAKNQDFVTLLSVTRTVTFRAP
ncbi:hypothetical protein LOK49_LG15G01574 [Camellia lanceoleosa]|uniref:Uncharacterized protein n=1 Tax=Camellia lanceoleosa TaxID=1840588 RepID=A0ACC0F6R1_9ERIC|nr:hypothetical protein LOK49_LG15G01574 [Camellia lanceoleosa]